MGDESSFLNPARALELAGIAEGYAVADFGAGSGFFTRAAARRTQGGVVWAVDDNSELLNRIKNFSLAEGLTNVEILHGNIEASKGSGLPANHFDLVIAANILFSADKKEKVVKEMHRVLKRNGRALVIDWSASHGGLGPHTDHVITEAAAKELFEEGGFSVGAKVPAGAYHWGFIVRKKAQDAAH